MGLKISNVGVGVFLTVMLISCTRERINYVSQPRIPANLLLDCLPPLLPEKLTFGKSILYNEKLLNVIEACNADKKAIKQISQSTYFADK